MKYKDNHTQELLKLLYEGLDNDPSTGCITLKDKEYGISIYNRGQRGTKHLAAVLVHKERGACDIYIGETDKGTRDCYRDVVKASNRIKNLDERVLNGIRERIFDL